MSSIEEQNRKIIRHIYESAAAGDIDGILSVLHEDFEERVPPILPWGGVHRGSEGFMKIIPMVAAAVDFGSLRLVSLSADGDHVAALCSGRSTSGKELWIAEHWKLRDGKAVSLMVFYHDTTPLMPNAKAQN